MQQDFGRGGWGGIIQNRGNWAGEHTAILSNVSNKQNLQMFVCTNDLWSYRTLAGLMDAHSQQEHTVKMSFTRREREREREERAKTSLFS